MAKRTFFDQWYRLANLRVGLRPSVSVRQTRYRDEIWYVYHEPIYNGFFRARPQTHDLIAQITPECRLADIWRDVVELHPESAPGQEEFFDLIASLYRANLLYVEGAVSESRLLERSFAKTSKPFLAQISELFFLKIPIWDPDRFLTRHLGMIDALFSPLAIGAAAILMLSALIVFGLNAGRAFDQGAHILQANNILALFVVTFVTHIFHEMAHAALCKKFGGDVRNMGIMLMMFAPLPYADVTSSWLMRNGNHRAAIGAAGMFSDLIICSLATLFWAVSPPGMANGLALNIMFTTAVYTFVFNVNPLMRFDGYYILSDILRIPNLHQAAKAQFTSAWRAALLREPVKPGDITSTRRRIFLIAFFVISFIYRNIVSFGIVLFLADQYFGLGLIGAVAIAYNSFIMPLGGAWRDISSPHFRARHRKLLRSGTMITVAVIVLLTLIPMPDFRRVQGVIETIDTAHITAQVDGTISKIYPENGQFVAQGAPLFQLENPELDSQLRQTRAKIAASEARRMQSSAQGGQSLGAVQRELQSLTAEQADLERRLAALNVTAPQAGIWVAAQNELRRGNWLVRGAVLGQILGRDRLRFRGILPQTASYGLNVVTAGRASLRILGDPGPNRDLTKLAVIPYSSKDLPAQSLTPLGGGAVSVSPSGSDELQSVERFFLVDAVLADTTSRWSPQGRTAWLRMRLPARPLMAQWLDAARQFLQARYKL